MNSLKASTFQGSFFFTITAALWIYNVNVQSKRRNSKTVSYNSVSTVSAPGKALVAGGYLVLERPNVGIVISSTSRFYCTITTKVCLRTCSKLIPFVIESPQFHTIFSYNYDVKKNKFENISGVSNEFIEKCLGMTMSFIKEHYSTSKFEDIVSGINGSLAIKLRADNDFYSHVAKLNELRKPLRSSSLLELPRFLPCPKDENGNVIVAKTGMGSSAALTTALVAGLLQFFDVIHLQDVNRNARFADRTIIHNLSQLVHAVAQGKIGSGFDVAAAVYGTQMYCRFAPQPLSNCMDLDSEHPNYPNVLYTTVINTKHRQWNQKIIPLSLPPGLDIVMGDVSGGSSSTSMARQVLQWRKDGGEEASQLWQSLGANNSKIFNLIQELLVQMNLDMDLYERTIRWAKDVPSNSWNKFPSKTAGDKNVINILVDLCGSFKKSRQLLHDMGELAGVAIEPPRQSVLLNATESIPGVLASGIPGAGGEDAVYAIILSEEVRDRVELLWSKWIETENGVTVCPLTLQSERSIENSGVRIEYDIKWDD